MKQPIRIGTIVLFLSILYMMGCSQAVPEENTQTAVEKTHEKSSIERKANEPEHTEEKPGSEEFQDATEPFEQIVETATPSEKDTKPNHVYRHGLPLGSGKAEGLSEAKLEKLKERAREESSSALIVLKNGKLITETYFGQKDMPLVAMSASKSLVSLTIGILLNEGKISSIDMKMAQVFTEWKGTPKEKITLYQMLTHTSGLETLRTGTKKVNGQWTKGQISDGLKDPLKESPDTIFRYNNRAVDLLALFVGRVAKKPLDVYLQDKLFTPMGIKGAYWMKDADGVPMGAGELFIRPIDLAKVGLLLLQKGIWKDKRLIAEKWIQMSWAASKRNPHCGLLWWRRALHNTYKLTKEILEQWEKSGLDAKYVTKLKGIVGKTFTLDEYRRALMASLGNDNAAIRKLDSIIKSGGLFAQILPKGKLLYTAEGWLGQFLAIDPEKQLVAVRMRRPTREDYQSSQYKNTYPTFTRDVHGLTLP